MSIFPNLFLVGFQKCGSSSLFDLLVQHSGISGSHPKETFALVDKGKANYHQEKNIKNRNFDWGDYFESRPTKYYLEASVCNFHQETALEYIAGLREKKVIFILRDPIQRFCSTFDYYGSRVTTHPITSLSAYFNMISTQPKKLNVEGARYALEHGKYWKYIRQWQEAVGKENVHLVGFKQLVTTPDICMESINEFLGIPAYTGQPVLKHKNKTKKIKYKQVDFYARRILGGSGWGKTFLGRRYQKMNRTQRKPPLNEELKEKLTGLYREEFENLKEYF